MKESKKQFEDEKEESSDKEDAKATKNQLTIDNKTSMSSAKSMTQLKDASDGVKRRNGRRESKLRSVSHIEQTVDDSDGFEDIAGPPEKGIRPSKSDTSLTESFVMIDNDGGGRRLSYKQNILRDGEWRESFKNRELIFLWQVSNGNSSWCSGQSWQCIRLMTEKTTRNPQASLHWLFQKTIGRFMLVSENEKRILLS